MRIASINLNKRLGSAKSRETAYRWFCSRKIELLLTQEPWKGENKTPPDLYGFAPIGGNGRVFAWISSKHEQPKSLQITDYWQRIELGYLVVANVYLDAYSKSTRAEQLSSISQGFQPDRDRPLLIVGDFNISPTPEEGLFDGKPSSFNSEVDRGALKVLQREMRLLCCPRNQDQEPEWTIERKISGKLSQFRCDFALLSDYFADEVDASYDHSVRRHDASFTDHSALILEVPVTIPRAKSQLDLFPIQENSGSFLTHDIKYCPHKTAMARQSPSPIAVKVVNDLTQMKTIRSILDYGCGRGEDVRYYRESGLNAEGYDSYAHFGRSSKPVGEFDLVTLVFVLNVLPDPWSRIQVLREVVQFLDKSGELLVVTRSPAEIERESRKKGWPEHNDGFWSHEGKGTFQRGIGRGELLGLASRVGLELSPMDGKMQFQSGATHVLFRRKA
ncbi:methyltransferase domain-containing protein [Acidobacteriota bacterium]